MKFNTKTRYGIRVMIEVALNSGPDGIYQKDIAQNQDLSVKYLDQIIASLKAAGLIANVRGRKSGYILGRDPSQITIYDIHRAFEPGICIVDCLSKNYDCEKADHCTARDFWDVLNQKVVDHFKSMTVEELVADVRKRNEEKV